MFNYLSNTWKKWPYKGITYIALIVIAIILIVLIALRGGKTAPTQVVASPEPKVQAQTLDALSKAATIDTVTSVQLANSAPLIARLGGRVTAIYGELGSHVRAGAIVVDIDGGVEANPARVQEENASILLGLFNDIQAQTEASLNSSITLATNSLNAAKAGSTITAAIQSKNRDIATNGINQAEVARDKALDAGDDFLIRSANVGVDAAKLAATQALLAERLANRQTVDGVKQAQQNLAGATIAKNQTLASLASQKAGLEAQLRSAAEQVKLMRVTAPLAGEVSRLSVQVGDFVHPGDIVGEVFGGNNATATVFVPAGARKDLYVGQLLDVIVDGEKQVGTISALSSSAGSDTALWQVNITLVGAVQAHSTVTVKLPMSVQQVGTVFIPLNAVNVRQSGAVVLTVQDGVVRERAFTPIHYYNNYVEGSVDLPASAVVITSGNRTLRDGDHVSVESNS
ncbi:MAG: HlyD family efflux transporter periplasmic adaptor subunit [Candidatus Andersenbacteria bacterium]|nr:HlyD family efflux transporter periplasmic adaptor subunit [Candidatus Andersenbacteria bacterium]